MIDAPTTITKQATEHEFLMACLQFQKSRGGDKRTVIGLRISRAVIDAFAVYFGITKFEATNRISSIAVHGSWDAVMVKNGQVSTLYPPGVRQGDDLLARVMELIVAE